MRENFFFYHCFVLEEEAFAWKVKRCVERRCLREELGRTELGFISHAIPHPDLRQYLKFKVKVCSMLLCPSLCDGSSSSDWLCAIWGLSSAQLTLQFFRY